MFITIAHLVDDFKRIQMGELKLSDDLAVGEWQWLREDDMEKLSLQT